MIDLFLVNESIIAVDIGLKGGVVMNHMGQFYIHHLTPEQLVKWIRDADKVVAEDVHAWSGQGLKSTSTLIEQKGFLRGVCAAWDVKVEFIQPIKWIECYTLKRTGNFKTKKDNKDKKAWKEHLLSIAVENASDEYKDQLTLQTADAFLMWNWAAAKSIGAPLEKLTLQLKFL